MLRPLFAILALGLLGVGSVVEADPLRQAEPTDGEIIGRWLDKRPFVSGPIEISRVDGNVILEQTFTQNGSVLRHELKESRSPLGRRLDPTTDIAGAGDHWVIDANGNLQIRDSEGLIATAMKIE